MEESTWNILVCWTFTTVAISIVCFVGYYVELQAKIKVDEMRKSRVDILESLEVFDKRGEILDFEVTSIQTLSINVDKNISFLSNSLNKDFLIIFLILLLFLLLIIILLLIILFFLYFKDGMVKKTNN